MTKKLSGAFLLLYLAILIWLVLFKLSFPISRVFNYHHRSLNLIPFAAPKKVNGRIDFGEMILNCLVFIPFGLLLDVNFKKVGFLSKFIFIMAFSISAEIIQYIFAIGATDITDVISNTTGGVLGLLSYNLGNKFITTAKLDRVILFAGSILFLLFMSMHVNHFFQRLGK